MAKHQSGLRIDRDLYKRFQELCSSEKLRVGKGAELLMRLAVDAEKIMGLNFDRENTGRMVDDALFRSRLTRLKTSLELEEKQLELSWEDISRRESDSIIQELRDLARRGISPELVKEFETCLVYADKVYEQNWKTYLRAEPEQDR